MNPPKFSGFDESNACEYYMGEKGHDVDNCLVQKIKVQGLIDKGILNFKEPETNIQRNPLPDHQTVNVLMDELEEYDFDDETVATITSYVIELEPKEVEEASTHLAEISPSKPFIKETPVGR